MGLVRVFRDILEMQAESFAETTKFDFALVLDAKFERLLRNLLRYMKLASVKAQITFRKVRHAGCWYVQTAERLEELVATCDIYPRTEMLKNDRNDIPGKFLRA